MTKIGHICVVINIEFVKTEYFSEYCFLEYLTNLRSFLDIFQCTADLPLSNSRLIIGPSFTPHTPTRKGGEGLDWRRRVQEHYFPELFSCNTLCHFGSCHLPAPGICWPQSHVSYGDTITSGHRTKVSCTPRTLDRVPWVFLSCLERCAFINSQCVFPPYLSSFITTER